MAEAINLCSPTFDPYDGYGQIAVRLVEHLTQAGQYVNAFSTGDLVHDTQADAVREALGRPIRVTTGGIMLGYPTHWAKYGALFTGGPMVGVTMFESTGLPEGWAEMLNRCRAVVVPAQWLVAVFKQNGVRVPIHVIPLGISETYRYTRRLPGRKPFTFLTLGDRWRRKGWDAAVLAFNQAFGTDPNYHLIIKARAGSMKLDINHPCVEIMREDLTERQMQELFGRVDAYVDANRGEGFGLVGRQAAATGLPVIATEWGGTADHLRAWAYPLRYTLVEAWQDDVDKRGKLGEWAEPDVEHLAEQMQYVASGNPMVAHMGRQSARRVCRLYDWKRFADGVLAVWQKAVEVPVTDRRRKWKAKEAARA